MVIINRNTNKQDDRLDDRVPPGGLAAPGSIRKLVWKDRIEDITVVLSTTQNHRAKNFAATMNVFGVQVPDYDL